MYEIGLTLIVVLGSVLMLEMLYERRAKLRGLLLILGVANAALGLLSSNFPHCFAGLVILAVAGIMYLD